MADVAVDSSVVAKWVLPETDSPHALRRMAEITGEGSQLVVLDLALIQVTNAIWRWQYRNLLTADEARQCLRALLRLPFSIEPASRLLAAGLEIAIQYDRAVYDALFVALARDLGIDGVTADEPLQRTVGIDFPEIHLLKDW